MNINVYDKSSLEPMKQAGRIAAMALDIAEKMVAEESENLTLMDLENAVNDFILSMGGTAECKGYKQHIGNEPYKYATCISVDDVACHGLPSDEKLKNHLKKT